MTAPDVPTKTASLPGGGAMPLLGYGTWKLSGKQATQATGQALTAGYRHLDTATIYGNEGEVGAAIAGAGLPRGELFVTTKVSPDDAGRERATLEQSLELLGLSSVDLWLLHWPGDELVAAWQALLDARSDGLATDVGVSNFSLDQLDEVTRATGEAPAVNQIRWSPLLFEPAVLEGHRERGVVLEGYSGLKGGALEQPTITGVAERLGRTPAQVIVRWHLQHDTVVIPKSSDAGRLAANADVGGFTLSDDDMAALDALGG